jgi:hypothetical protein
VDEFSAVSRRLPIWQLYERARSLGLAVQVSAQSWQGLAADDDERYRIAASADGGIWLLRTPHPEPVTGLAGTRKLVDTSRRLLGVPIWGHQGTSRIREAPVVDPALIRSLDVGQVAYIYRGGVTFIQVKRLIGGPAALAGPVSATAAQAGLRAYGQPALVPSADGSLSPGSLPDGRSAAAGRSVPPQAGPEQAGPEPSGPGQFASQQPVTAPAPAGASAHRPLPDIDELLDEAFGAEAGP